MIIPRYSISRRTQDSRPKRFFAQFRPTISALGYPKYGTPISVLGHPSLQSVQWLNMFGLQVTLYANLITSDGREETKHVFH